MTLLDAKPPKPPSRLRKLLPLIIIVAVLVGTLLAIRLWDYPEEQAVSRFLSALEAGNYPEAYRLWQPAPSYSYGNFLHDWGPEGDYGRIRQFAILGSRSKRSAGSKSILSGTVIVAVRINDAPPLDLWVDRRTKGLSFSVE